MGAKRSALFLLKSGASGMRKRPSSYHTDEIIPYSGIYRVIHLDHRLPHEVTLLRDERFPKCAKCQTAVTFELVRAVALAENSLEQWPQIRLYELPVFEDEHDVAV